MLGSLGALSNLHVALKTGWSLPFMTTAALVALSGSRGVHAAWSRVQPFHRGEITATASTASAAAYMAGGGNIAAVAALAMLGRPVPHPVLIFLFWCATAILGTLLASVVRRRVGNDSRRAGLTFPTASATAELASGASTRTGDARALGYATAVGGSFALARLALHVPPTIAMPLMLRGRNLASSTFGLDTSLLLFGVGALMNVRTALSVLVGGLATYLFIAPELLARGSLADASYTSIVGFMVWPTASLLVSASVVALIIDTGVNLGTKRARVRAVDFRRWLPAFAFAVATTALAHFAWGLPLAYALLALPIAVAVSAVAARTMEETDVVPTRALAAFVQLLFAGAGAGLSALCMVPNITGSVALHAADTVGSLKIAGVAGLKEGEIVVARAVGVVAGGAAVLMGYLALVPRPQALPTSEMPAPSILVWRSVAEVLALGAGSIPASVRAAMLVAAIVGSVLSLLEWVLPPRFVRFIPSAVGLGSGMVLPASNAVTLAIGALARAFYERGAGVRAKSVPLASGIIAGESAITVAWQVVDALRHVTAS